MKNHESKTATKKKKKWVLFHSFFCSITLIMHDIIFLLTIFSMKKMDKFLHRINLLCSTFLSIAFFLCASFRFIFFSLLHVFITSSYFNMREIVWLLHTFFFVLFLFLFLSAFISNANVVVVFISYNYEREAMIKSA